jgi:purine-nucleoside phosphorylase
MILGFWGGKPIAVLKGRFHFYEGHVPEIVALPLRVMHRLGVRSVLLTNAAGGLDQDMIPGDLMLIRDHIGLWTDTPLRGLNLDEIGPRFPDQSQVYDRVLGDLAVSCASELDIPLHEGVYAYCRGPQFETPAEIRLLKMLGASAVGMSTVPEAIAASHGGMRVLAISCITNVPVAPQGKPLNHQEVLDVATSASDRTIRLLECILSRLDEAERTGQ